MPTITDLATDTLTHGGSTRNLHTGEAYNDGVAVGIPGYEQKIPGAATITVDRLTTALAAYLFDLIAKDVFGDSTSVAVGTWVNPDDDTIYVDMVEMHYDLDTALTVATERGELAVFDLGTMTEHRTGVVRA